ncbi:MAG: hypothetical protein U0800_21495 [Isosphaeraceae bacterium]
MFANLWAQAAPGSIAVTVITLATVALAVMIVVPILAGLRYIPNNRVGVVEKLWSGKGSVTGGRITR